MSTPVRGARAPLLAVLVLAPSAASAVDGGGPSPTPEPIALATTVAGAAVPARWTAAFQSTYVLQRKPSMHAAYTGENSLVPEAETGYTLTGTIFLGVRPWSGGELFVNGESIQSEELSRLHGLGGLSNGENQKTGGPLPTPYVARAFWRQTVDLGGALLDFEAGQNQLAGRTTSRRLVITAGKLAVTDVFDANAYSHDARTQFLNWTFMTYGASDYAADARGYTWGAALEWYQEEWAVRLGRFAQPRESNGLYLDPNLLRQWGDEVELEHAHEIGGLAGKLRTTGIRNHADMGAFRDALAVANGGTPSVAGVRRLQDKWAFGASLEQALPLGLGLFARYSWNDGRTETYAFTEIERSIAGGICARGTAWGRPGDTAGAAFAWNGLGDAHRDYLAAGGLGAFIGDGRLSYAAERIAEAYYSWNVVRGFWVSADLQQAWNPAYNADRGPATFVGGRVHLEI